MKNTQFEKTYNEWLENIPWKFREKISVDPTLVSINWKPYSDIFVYEYNWEIYCYTKDWENVFLMEPENESLKKWFKVEDWAESFSFKEIDWKYLLEVWLSWGNFYFLENWKNYIPEPPKTSWEKYDQFVESYLDASKKLKQDISNLLYTEDIEKFWYIISDHLEKVQDKIVWLLKNTIDYWFSKIATGVDLNLYGKPGKWYQNNKHKKK